MCVLFLFGCLFVCLRLSLFLGLLCMFFDTFFATGKTTTFGMLTGDIGMSGGEAWIQDYSVLTQMNKVRQHIGYTPQFDALCPLLTGRETLEMFAQLKGVPSKAIPKLVNWIISSLHLTKYADRTSDVYSGGNKRKLSVGVALIGQPPLLLLDEVS